MYNKLKLIVGLVIVFQSCDLLDVVEFQEPNRYKGCCGISAVEDTVGTTLVSIPNAITPNADGKNDAFSIYSSDVLQISSIQVTEQNDLLAIDRKDIPVKRGWTKIWVPKNASGIVIQGLYNYSITFNEINGTEKTLSGQFCAFTCGEDKVETIPHSDCSFRTQVDESGHFANETSSQDTCAF